jgi:hypothetical protein
MNYEDYYYQVKNDAIEAIDEQFDNGYWDEDTEWDVAYDNLFVDDSVTGNGSGSYTFNAFKARENVSEAIFDDRIVRALDNIGCDAEYIMNYIRENDPESIDVCIRCAMLDEVYDEIERHFYDRQSQLQ